MTATPRSLLAWVTLALLLPGQQAFAMASKVDLLVWGSTGYTGSLVAEYLLRQYGAQPSNFTWGLGGRSKEKLTQLKERLSKEVDPQAHDLPVVVGDAHDDDSIAHVAAQTRVVVTTAGPYVKHGSKLVEACIKAGTHYADLTGEVLWMHEIINKHYDEAKAKGVKITHTCGFDSIPSDMGALMMTTWIKENLNRKTRSVKMIHGDAKGGVSGGTIASLVGEVEMLSASPKSLLKLYQDSYLLNPPDNKPDWDKGFGGLGYDKVTGSWTFPFVMAPINARVVRRSNALLGNEYGAPFSYTEVGGKPGVKGLFISLFATAISAFMKPVLFFGPTRRLLLRLLPKQGEGPSKEARDSGYFWATVVAESEPGANGEPPVTVTGRVGSSLGDPGYKETAHMLAEAGLSLALGGDKLPDTSGVLTPASAMGTVLLERLRNTGMTFEVAPPKKAAAEKEEL